MHKIIHLLKSIPIWGLTLLLASMLYKLNWLDGQLNVGGMNQWKWAVNAGALLIATGWTLLLGRTARVIALVALNFVLTFIIYADLIYFRTFKDFISIPVLLQANQVSKLTDSIENLMHAGDWILFADWPIACALAGGYVWLNRRKKAQTTLAAPLSDRASSVEALVSTRMIKPVEAPAFFGRTWPRVVSFVLVFAIGFSLLYYPINMQKNGWARGLFAGNWWNIPIYNVTGLFGFHGYDSYRYAKEHWVGKGLSEEEINEARSWFADRKQLQKQMEVEPLFGEYKGYNILVVQAEAFQDFVLNQSIGGQEITPNLNRLIEESLYFPNFYHQTAQGRTSDADFAANCSMHPLPTGSVFIRFATNSLDCSPVIFGNAGYDTTVHHAYDGSFWNRYNMYNNLEYNQFYDLKAFRNDEPLGWSIGDKSFFRQTVKQIKSRQESPFYAFTITISSHHPFEMPATEKKLDVGSFSGTTFGDYLHAAHYVDTAMGVLIDDLKQAELWDNTIIVFYGDHDNSLYDEGPYAQFLDMPITALDKDKLARKVPFFIHLPGGEHTGILEKAGGQVDVTPTLMHLLGISAERYNLMGISLLSEAPKPVVFRNGGFTNGFQYYIPNPDGSIESSSCYALPEQEPLATAAACSAGIEAARTELRISDRVIEHNLQPVLAGAMGE